MKKAISSFVVFCKLFVAGIIVVAYILPSAILIGVSMAWFVITNKDLLQTELVKKFCSPLKWVNKIIDKAGISE